MNLHTFQGRRKDTGELITGSLLSNTHHPKQYPSTHIITSFISTHGKPTILESFEVFPPSVQPAK